MALNTNLQSDLGKASWVAPTDAKKKMADENETGKTSSSRGFPVKISLAVSHHHVISIVITDNYSDEVFASRKR